MCSVVHVHVCDFLKRPELDIKDPPLPVSPYFSKKGFLSKPEAHHFRSHNWAEMSLKLQTSFSICIQMY